MHPHLHLYWRKAAKAVDNLQIQPRGEWGLVQDSTGWTVFKLCHPEGHAASHWVPLMGKWQTKELALQAITDH